MNQKYLCLKWAFLFIVLTLLSFSNTLQAQMADVELRLSANPTTLSLYGFVEVIATIENKGPADANNLTVHVPIPAGQLAYTSQSETAGNYNLFFNEWRIGQLAAGASAQLTLTLFVLQENTPIQLFSELTAADDPDPDSTPGNGTPPTPNEDDEALLTLQPPGSQNTTADLELAVRASATSYYPSDQAYFLFQLTNEGPDAAQNVQINAMAPSALNILAPQAERGTFNGGIWTIDRIAAGETLDLLVPCEVQNTQAPIEYFAEVQQADSQDPDATAGNGRTNTEDDEALARLTPKTEAPAIAWQLTDFGSPDVSFGQAVQALSDGGFLALGLLTPNNGVNGEKSNFLLIRTDKNGQTLWKRVYGTTENGDIPVDLASLPDGNFLVGINKNTTDGNPNINIPNATFWKVTPQGDVLWERELLARQRLLGFDVLSNGQFVVVAEDRATNSSRISKYTSDGVFVSDALISGQTEGVVAISSDDILLTGSRSTSSGFFPWIARLNSDLSLQWEIDSALDGFFTAYDAAEMPSGELLIAASKLQLPIPPDPVRNSPQLDFSVLKISADGQLLSNREFGGSRDEFPEALLATTDGHYVLTGRSFSSDGDVRDNYGGNREDIWLVKVNASLEIVWEQHFGGSNFDVAYDLAESSDGDLSFIGITRSVDNDVEDNDPLSGLWLVKLGDPVLPMADLEIEMRAFTSSYNAGDQHRYALRVYNKGPEAAEGVRIDATPPSALTIDSSSPDQGTFSNGIWEVGTVAVGDTIELEWQVTVGNVDVPIEYFAEIAESNSDDPDATSGNGETGIEDDEAKVIITPKVDPPGFAWKTRFGIDGNSVNLHKIIAREDGTFLCLGSSVDGSPNSNQDVLLLEVDADGEVLSSQLFGGIEDEFSGRILALPNDELLLAATTQSPGFLNNGLQEVADIVVFKIDKSKTILESFHYALPGPDNQVVDWRMDGQGNVYMLTFYRTLATVPLVYQLYKFRADNLVPELVKEYLSPFSLSGLAINENDQILVSGNNADQQFKSFAELLNADGSVVWSREYELDLPLFVQDIEKVQDGFLLGGIINKTRPVYIGNGLIDFATLKISPAGDLLWFRHLGGSDAEALRDILVQPDGRFVLTGYAGSLDGDVTVRNNNARNSNFWVVQCDVNGQIIWEKRVGGSTFDEGNAAVFTDDDGIVVAGEARSNDGDLSDQLQDQLAGAFVFKLGTPPAPALADIELSFTPSDITYEKFTFIQFTARIENTGGTSASGLKVKVPIPDGLLAYNSHSQSKGHYDVWLEEWTIDELAPGESATLSLNLFVLDINVPVNIFAELLEMNEEDFDSTPGNGDGQSAREDDEAVATIVPRGIVLADEADLSLNIDANTSSFYPNENQSFDLFLFNNGPETATNIQVDASLPNGTSLQNSQTNEGLFNNGIWTIPELPAGQSALLTVTLNTLNNAGPIAYYTQVVGADTRDPNATPGNGTNGNPMEDDEAQITIYPKETPPNLQWQFDFSNASRSFTEAVDACPTSDGGYIGVGFEGASNASSFDLLVVKSDANGLVEWHRLLGGSDFDAALAILRLQDDSFLIVGKTTSDDGDFGVNNGDDNLVLLQIDEAGDLVDQVILATNSSGEETFVDVALDASGDVLLAYSIIEGGTQKARVAKFSGQNLTPISIRTLFQEGDFLAFTTAADGGYVGVSADANRPFGFNVQKFEADGRATWRLNSANDNVEIVDICQCPDGGYALATTVNANNQRFDIVSNGKKDMGIIKLDDRGRIQNDWHFGGPEDQQPSSIGCDADGGYLLVGSSDGFGGDVGLHNYSLPATATGLWALSIREDGRIIWDKKIGDDATSRGRSIRPTPDGGWILSGINSSTDPNLFDDNAQSQFWMVKLEGDTIPSVNNQIDLELTASSGDPNFAQYGYIDYIFNLRNQGDVAAQNVVVDVPFPDNFVYVLDSTTVGHYDGWLRRWNVGTLEAGQSARLNLSLFALQADGPRTLFAQVLTASPEDVDSTPGNDVNGIADEDDEAAVTVFPLASLVGRAGTANQALSAKHPLAIRHLYPVPTSDELYLIIESLDDRSTVLTAYNGLGIPILERSLSLRKGMNRFELDVRELPSGMYFLLLDEANRRNTKWKFLKIGE
ncbi:MAG: hypothetical protein AAF990_05340 [Bacteroidota bacterium]